MGMGSDEWNKGYFSCGPQHSYDAQQGAWARQQDEAREARAREERAQAERDRDMLASMRQAFTVPVPGWQQYTAYPPSSAAPRKRTSSATTTSAAPRRRIVAAPPRRSANTSST